MSCPDISPTVEDLAAEALSIARIVATAIREDVLHRLKPQRRCGPERLLRAIDRRGIFEPRTLDELASLEAQLVPQITEGTVMVNRAEAGEGNVSPVYWREPRLTEDADALSNALAVILELTFLLEAIQDRLAAETAIETLRQNL